MSQFDFTLFDLRTYLHTNPAQSSGSDELHELVVAHVTQKALQTALPWR